MPVSLEHAEKPFMDGGDLGDEGRCLHVRKGAAQRLVVGLSGKYIYRIGLARVYKCVLSFERSDRSQASNDAVEINLETNLSLQPAESPQKTKLKLPIPKTRSECNQIGLFLAWKQL